MDAADFERASATVLDLLRLMTDEQRAELTGRLDGVWCHHCGREQPGWRWCQCSNDD